MAGFEQVVTENRRLEILGILKEDPGYETNAGIIQGSLGWLGLQTSMDRVRTDLAWLKEQGLVTLSEVGGVQLAKITQQGLDCARGLSRIPGVARPAPGE